MPGVISFSSGEKRDRGKKNVRVKAHVAEDEPGLFQLLVSQNPGVLVDFGPALPASIEEIANHLAKLHGYVKPATVAQRRVLFKDSTMKEMEEIAAKSTWVDWHGHPSYFIALVEEAHSRPPA